MKWHEQNDILPWLSDHFIQIIIRQNHHDTPADYYDHADINNYYRELYGLPWLSWMRVNCESGNFSHFTDFVEYQINNEYALEPCLDRYYFPFSTYYNKEHFIHSTFVYGYDNTKKTVFVADFWESGKYEHKEITYDEMNSSMDNNYIINLFKLQNATYTFNPILMQTFLEDYLKSTDSFKRFEFSNKEYNKQITFGLGYYDYLKEYCTNKQLIDIRFFHLLFDHKQLMKYRLEYLFHHKYLTSDSYKLLNQKNNELINTSLQLRTMVLKYNLTKDSNLLDRILGIISALKKSDQLFVSELLNNFNI